jgi:sulfatase-like protein
VCFFAPSRGLLLKAWCVALSKLFFGIYFFLTSFYCLLAFLPYTYTAVIKAPPYAWIPWFVKHHGSLYWLALFAAAMSCWKSRTTRWYRLAFGALAMTGLYLMARPFMPFVHDDNATYLWGLAALLPITLIAAADLLADSIWREKDEAATSLLSYSSAILAAVLIALLHALGILARRYVAGQGILLAQPLYDFELIGWSVISHAVIAIILLSVLNLFRMAAARTVHPLAVRLALLGSLTWVVLCAATEHFFQTALSFEGWRAHVYAAGLAATLSLFGIFAASSFFLRPPSAVSIHPERRRFLLVAACVGMVFAAALVPRLIEGGDWGGILQTSLTLTLWVVLGTSLYMLRPRCGRYSLAAVLGMLILTGCGYKALQASAIFWAKPLGLDDGAISLTLESYANKDASFALAHHVLGNSRSASCGELCRVLRQYANVRNATARADLKLVDPLVPTQVIRPNIFIFVIDSMRPDYLGAYNPRADFTPNLDKLAQDSIVLRNVYTQYAGTSLSEPAIWSGAMLLHAHFLQPFHRVNSLEKLAQVDGYQIMVSWDTVLQQILSPSPDLIKLDTDKLWNNFEACSTVEQAESALDNRADKTRPVLFYSQPMNVHQFAKNNIPIMTRETWPARPGFVDRISYEVHYTDGCLGRFFNYLKTRGLYDNSVIIVTADHGDATGEFGRSGHSLIIYPEIMRVPLIVHLPKNLRQNVVYDNDRISVLTDITPSLYYLLGHRPIVANPTFGRPLFAETPQELHSYKRDELFLASDVRAVFGLLSENGRWLYATYDSPAESRLFDLAHDPNATHNVVTENLKKQYDTRVIEYLQAIGDFYGYKPGVGSLLTSHR